MKTAALLTVLSLGPLSPCVAQTVAIPFIGCLSDGQVGPIPRPVEKARMVQIPPADAAQLAYYQAKYTPGILAPRGWHCFSTYGSSGATLYISPDLITSKMVFRSDWKGFAGPAIQISSMDGGTSGRFSVARTIARLFPEHMDFVQNVIAEGLEPATDFPRGPYPKDKITYKTKNLVEFETPPLTTGLGTDSRLQAANTPIQGVEFLSMPPDDDSSVVSVAMRLPSTLNHLTPIILEQTERELTKQK